LADFLKALQNEAIKIKLAIDIKGKENNLLTAANEYKTFRTLSGNLHTI